MFDPNLPDDFAASLGRRNSKQFLRKGIALSDSLRPTVEVLLDGANKSVFLPMLVQGYVQQGDTVWVIATELHTGIIGVVPRQHSELPDWRLAWGQVGYVQAHNDSNVFTNVTEDIANMSVTATLIEGRLYKFSLYCWPVCVAPATTEIVRMSVTTSSNAVVLYTQKIAGQTTATGLGGTQFGSVVRKCIEGTPGDGEIAAGEDTFKLRGLVVGSAVDAFLEGSSTVQQQVVIEDIGPVI